MQRFSEEQFRVYEPLIEAAVYVLPARFTIDIPWNNYAQATVSRNLREAIQALASNPQWPTSVSRTKFAQYFNLLQVAEEPGHVIVRLRSRGQRADPGTSVSCQNVITFTRPVDPVVLSTLIELCNAGLIAGLRLANTGMSAENVETLTANTNVCVVTDANDIVLL